ncbi:hypothetical protein Droror1_Dr00007088 [Drosera rotundifolia]
MSSCSVPPGVRLGCQSLVEGELLVFGVRGVRLEVWSSIGCWSAAPVREDNGFEGTLVCVWLTVLPFCQAVKVLAFLTMPLEASSKDANQQLEFPWGLKSAVDNEHGSFGKRLEPTIRLCKKGFKGKLGSLSSCSGS